MNRDLGSTERYQIQIGLAQSLPVSALFASFICTRHWLQQKYSAQRDHYRTDDLAPG